MWKITSDGTITRLADAPHTISLGVYNRSCVHDPATGNFIFILGTAGDQSGELWELNPDGNGTWTELDSDMKSPGDICASGPAYGAGCSGAMFAAAIPTYGVIMYLKYNFTNSAVWLYKHTAGSAVEEAGPSKDKLCVIAGPNPFKSTIRIRASGPSAIYDVRGKRVFSTGEKDFVWNTRALPAGIYLLKTSGGEKRPRRSSCSGNSGPRGLR